MLARLFYEFFKIGLFTYGGGLAMLPLLQQKARDFGWFTEEQFTDMIAISQSTPGAIAINMATFVGYEQGNIIGSLLSSIGLIIPGFVIIMIIAKFLKQFNEKPVVKSIFTGLRATVIGLILTAIVNIATVSIFNLKLFKETNMIRDFFDIKSIILFGVTLFAVLKFKKHPIYYIIAAGIIGIIIW
ncbi:chromate transporter [Vallitalea longa]|uniref:Chromate transporter n=1 Tax=Vallitalea longa TaxID=2936439 RepID=A0A9W5YAN7_9FIRM|nr:chromate transporter [Vallitalea longa]GKX27808.1 chromate transporter [Vallitalea longa]